MDRLKLMKTELLMNMSKNIARQPDVKLVYLEQCRYVDSTFTVNVCGFKRVFCEFSFQHKEIREKKEKTKNQSQ